MLVHGQRGGGGYRRCVLYLPRASCWLFYLCEASWHTAILQPQATSQECCWHHGGKKEKEARPLPELKQHTLREGDVFGERGFNFLMKSNELLLANTHIGDP